MGKRACNVCAHNTHSKTLNSEAGYLDSTYILPGVQYIHAICIRVPVHVLACTYICLAVSPHGVHVIKSAIEVSTRFLLCTCTSVACPLAHL